MKDILQWTFQDKRFRNFLGFFLFGLICWFGGPYVAIAEHSVLASATHRLFVIFLLALLWGVSNLYFSKKNLFVTTTIADTGSSDLFSEIEELQNTLQETTQLLKEKTKKNIPWKHHPTYIILGAPLAGKTHLLISANNNNPPFIQEKYYDCFLINDTVYFDYTAKNTQVKTEQESRSLWQHFLKSLKKLHYRLLPQGIILILNISMLETKQESTALESLFQQLKDVIYYLHKLPVYLIITHCDQISGFLDFFDDLTQEERNKPFGFSFPSLSKRKKTLESFNTQFDSLLKHLNQRLLLRLHQELNQQKRQRLKDFPLHLQLIRSTCYHLIEKLTNIPNVYLQGCYFSSTQQIEINTNSLYQSIENAFKINISFDSSHYKYWQNKIFFVKDLFDVFFKLKNKKYFIEKSKLTYGIYFIAIITVIVPTFAWFLNYHQTIKAISTMEVTLKSNSPFDQKTYGFLPRLTALHDGLEKINHVNSLVHFFGLHEADQFKKETEHTYQQILVTQFLPALKQSVENQIIITTENPSNLYTTLKIYLMLNDLNHRNNDLLKQWFLNYWQQTLPHEVKEQNELRQQLAVVLKQSLTVPINKNIVLNARDNLNKISLNELCFSVLSDRYNQPIKIFDQNNAISIRNNYTIPSLYTLQNINQVYQDIPSACQEVINGNWVLGAKKGVSINITELSADVRSLYLNNYANAWQMLMQNIQIISPKNLSDISQTFKILSNNHSPFWQLLNNVSKNTAPNPNIDQFTFIVSSKFQDLNNFNQSSSVIDLHNSFIALAKYFSPIDNNKKAFMASKKRMENIDQEDALSKFFSQSNNSSTPSILQKWLNPLATESWHTLLENSQAYLNVLWQQNVLISYNDKINYRYPIFKNGHSDITLSDFTLFFSPKGILNNFFNEYLKPFVDTSHVYWVWKSRDNDHLNIPQTTLEMFIRAALIEKMFFADSSSQPTLKFTLIPIALEPGVSDFKLNLEGQNVDFQPHQSNETKELIWPGPSPDNVTVSFTNEQGHIETLTQTGPWAWFKILDQANLQTTLNNPKQFKLVFDLNGYSAQYELVTTNLINPFIKGIVDVFRCPEHL